MVCKARSLEVDVIGISIQAKRSGMVGRPSLTGLRKGCPLLGRKRNKIRGPEIRLTHSAAKSAERVALVSEQGERRMGRDGVAQTLELAVNAVLAKRRLKGDRGRGRCRDLRKTAGSGSILLTDWFPL